MQHFPTFAFHKEKAPDGRLVNTQEELAALLDGEDDWVDTPAAFDPNYVRPARSAPTGSIPEDAAARGFVPAPFPSFRFNRAGDERLVQNQAEADALGPDWKHSPDPSAWGASLDSAAPVVASLTTAGSPTPASSGDDVEAAERKAAEELAAKARELHATPVADVIKALDGCPDKEKLQKVKEMEMLNPAGPRVTLVRGIDTAVKALDAPPDTAPQA